VRQLSQAMSEALEMQRTIIIIAAMWLTSDAMAAPGDRYNCTAENIISSAKGVQTEPSQTVGVTFNIFEKQDTIEVVADPDNKPKMTVYQIAYRNPSVGDYPHDVVALYRERGVSVVGLSPFFNHRDKKYEDSKYASVTYIRGGWVTSFFLKCQILR
jgi:hypothetical protein